MDKTTSIKRLPMQLPLRDYERAFRVMHSVLMGAESTPEHACVFFAIVGAYLLNSIYNLGAYVVAGTALYRFDNKEDSVAYIGGNRGGHEFSDKEHFHMWIQTETHAIDFQAPVFREALGDQTKGFTVPRLMFQRGLTEQCNGQFKAAGDFDLYPNPELTNDLVDHFLARNDAVDLLNICGHWFKKPPKPIQPNIGLVSTDGIRRILVLSPLRVDGAWGR